MRGNPLDLFATKCVTVIGDVMLDSYLTGKVERISPEAPVPVVLLSSTNHKLGGAANVALNLRALGAQVNLISVVGDDEEGRIMLNLLKSEGIDVQGVVQSNSRSTTVKTRIMGNQVQMLRIDRETTHPLDAALEQQLLASLEKQLLQSDVLLFSDYDKGVLSSGLIEAALALAKSRGVPTVVDPKKRHFNAYRGVTLFKPNLKELRDGLGIELDSHQPDHIMEALQPLLKDRDVKNVMLTMSEAGMVLTDGASIIREPAHLRTIADVSGAGDTVVSVAALCLASGLTNEELVAWSNLAGGIVCEYPGVIPVPRERLLDEAKKLHLMD